MDLDFILTCIVYLAVILFIHITLKNKDNVVTIQDNDNLSSKIDKEDSGQDDGLEKSNDSSSIMTQEDNLIINANELDSINSDMSNNDFIKYLDVEGVDSDTDKHQLVTPLKDNTIDLTADSSTNDLDKYFANVKEEQYTFDPVPTSKLNQDQSNDSDKAEDSTGLYSDISTLNVDSKDKNIMPFDDFGEAYASI